MIPILVYSLFFVFFIGVSSELKSVPEDVKSETLEAHEYMEE